MKKVIFQMSVSLDGYFEGPNHELDWHVVDDEFNAYAVETLRATDVLIMGRRAYELMAGYWPTAQGDDPDVKEQMNETQKLVFSGTLKSVEWQNSRLATDPIADEVKRLKRIPGDGLLWVGGSELASAFLDQGLIDEVRFILTPICSVPERPCSATSMSAGRPSSCRRRPSSPGTCWRRTSPRSDPAQKGKDGRISARPMCRPH